MTKRSILVTVTVSDKTLEELEDEANYECSGASDGQHCSCWYEGNPCCKCEGEP